MQLQEAIGRLFPSAIQSVRAIARGLVDFLKSPHVTFLIGEPTFWLLGMRRRRRKNDLSQVKRVLVVRLDEIGDVVLTTPFIRELRRNLPEAHITLIVKPAVHNLVENCPYIDEVLTYNWDAPGRYQDFTSYGRALKVAFRYLWHRRFDLAVLPRWDADNYRGTLLTYFSGAPWRVGYSEGVTREKAERNAGLDHFLTEVIDDSAVKHEAERNLAVISVLGGMISTDILELWINADEKGVAENILASHRILPEDFLVAFGPGAGHARRMWPLSFFAELGKWLKREYGARIVAVGGRGEAVSGEALGREMHDTVIDAVGRMTLRQTAAMLQRCHLFIGNDSAPMHLAAAAGIPVVEVSCHPQSGSSLHHNSPKRFGPWGVPHRVIQPPTPREPCHDGCSAAEAHCILEVTVEQVKLAVEDLLPNTTCRLERQVSGSAS